MPKINIRINQLAIEITRGCNMNPPCKHCMRGKPESLDMSVAAIDTLLMQIDHVEQVLFTGGEPTLNLQAIRKFYERAEKHNVQVDAFSIVTNGCQRQKELAALTLELYQKANRKENCAVAISEDLFHHCKIDDTLRGLKFYSHDREHGWGINWIVNEGNAKKNYVGDACIEPYPPFELDDPKKLRVMRDFRQAPPYVEISELYLAATGYLYTNFELSYKTMRKNQILHVKDLSDFVNKVITKR